MFLKKKKNHSCETKGINEMNRSNTEDSFRDKPNVMIQHEKELFGFRIWASLQAWKRGPNPKSINWLTRQKENELLDSFQSIVRLMKHLLISATFPPYVNIEQPRRSECLLTVNKKKKKDSSSLQPLATFLWIKQLIHNQSKRYLYPEFISIPDSIMTTMRDSWRERVQKQMICGI